MIRLPKPIIVPIRSIGTCSKMMLNIRGSAIPVPAPWMARPSSSRLKFGAKPSMRRPAKKSKLAVMNSFLVLKVDFKTADSGTMTEMTSR